MRRRQIQAAARVAARAAVAVVEPPPRPEPPIGVLRKRKGLTVEELADQLGMKPGALALIERTEAARARIRKHLNGQ